MLAVYKVFNQQRKRDRRRGDIRSSLDGRSGTIETRLDTVKSKVITRLPVSYF